MKVRLAYGERKYCGLKLMPAEHVVMVSASPGLAGGASACAAAARVGAVGLAGYRNSPEMRLTEPATMTTPNT